MIEENTGPGQLWVQVGDLSGLDPNAMFVNVATSDANGQESILCTNGNGNQLPVLVNIGVPPSTCTWANLGP